LQEKSEALPGGGLAALGGGALTVVLLGETMPAPR